MRIITKTYSPFFADYRLVIGTYQQIVDAVITPKKFAEISHIYAVSAVLKQRIKSYYPPVSLNNTLTGAFRTNIIGRDVIHHEPKCCLMWSCASMPNKQSYKPNHFTVLASKAYGGIHTLNNREKD